MHHALFISEILGLIFSFADEESKASSAQVCKIWSETALDALWCKLDTPEGLFNLLKLGAKSDERRTTVSYLLTRSQSQVEVAKGIQDKDLHRYFQISSRVQRLKVSFYDPTKYPPLSLVPYFTTSAFLTPNLTHLSWEKNAHLPGQSLTWCGLFLSRNLKSLEVLTGWDTFKIDVAIVNDFFSVASIRAPHLESFTFGSSFLYHAVGPGLSKLLASLTMLKSVRLDDAFLSSEVIETLATLPDLEEVRIPPPINYNAFEKTSDPDTILPTLGNGAFPSIKVLELKVPLSTLHPFLKPPFPVAQLQRLVIRTPRAESPAQIRAFFSTIATECPTINHIKLYIHTTVYHADFSPLPFSCLAPLLACRSLTALVLGTPSVLELDDAQAAAAASSWPQMRKLRLFAHMAFRPRNVAWPMRATCAALSAFAKHCPDLRNLDISVHLSGIPPPGARTPFQNLDFLDLGVGVGAAKYSRREVAAFIAEVTPPGSVVYGTALVHPEELHNTWKHEERLEETLSMVASLRRSGDVENTM